MKAGFITITEDRYIVMARAELFLSILESYGIKGWDGYDSAYYAFKELVKECPDVVD